MLGWLRSHVNQPSLEELGVCCWVDSSALEAALDEYYDVRGWGDDGVVPAEVVPV